MRDECDVVLRVLRLPEEATIDQALGALGEPLASELRLRIERADLAVAVYGKPRPLDAVLHEGDRIELVGELAAEPKEARRLRVQQQRSRNPELPRKRRRGP